jgi:hypothetical protein
MTGPDAEQLVEALERYVAAHLLFERLHNPESTAALQEARGNLARVLQTT